MVQWFLLVALVALEVRMAITGKTGADAFFKALKRQSIVWAKYGPKLLALANTMHSLGLLLDPEYTALTTGFNALPAFFAAMEKVAEYSGIND